MTEQTKQKKHNAKLPKIPSDKSMKQFLVKEIAALITEYEESLRWSKRYAEYHYNLCNKDDPTGSWHFKTLNQYRDGIRTQKAYLHKLRYLQKILKTMPDHVLTEWFVDTVNSWGS